MIPGHSLLRFQKRKTASRREFSVIPGGQDLLSRVVDCTLYNSIDAQCMFGAGSSAMAIVCHQFDCVSCNIVSFSSEAALELFLKRAWSIIHGHVTFFGTPRSL
jgi:hypothetical protein